MTPTQARLDAYYAAELRILTAGFSVRYDLRQRQEAELGEIRKAIAQLELRVAQEQSPGRAGSLRYSTVVFNGSRGVEGGGRDGC
ncbi:hypothetical protein NB688_000574 [Xanthomonas sacchari]|uniref:Uncharacterized protein n=1 Tax=Xanthomonas sacchari TaxID=56458 RepID=A0ABT3DTD5_9XANT|nr:hypothetical protein [Xanthomonas sacchari]MCW0398760.1 hypothetical protein [Xanthomonas sacchari]MCW0418408.1 hypothetical protein [Xanthomonas sacchari]UYK72529.1 hypothetical protein NG828_20470 [Xanthomonas sacchari]